MSNFRKTTKNQKQRLGRAVKKKLSFEDNYVLGIFVKRHFIVGLHKLKNTSTEVFIPKTYTIPKYLKVVNCNFLTKHNKEYMDRN